MSLYLSFFLLDLFLISRGAHDEPALKMGFYQERCPNVETIVRDIVLNRTATNPSLGAGLLRLHYHDCFVRVRIIQ